MKYVIVLSYFIQGVLLGAILILAVMGLFSLTELVSLLGVNVKEVKVSWVILGLSKSGNVLSGATMNMAMNAFGPARAGLVHWLI